MDKRKLIGTIIGVLMFGLLMAGATFAWLSFNATVTNTNVNGTTLNYWVNYSGGTSLTDIPILITPTTENAASVTVTAQRPKGSIADNIKIYLTTTSNNDLTTSGVVKYVICETECDANFNNNTIGSVTATSTVEIYSDTLPGTTDSTTNATVTYKVYFWLDAATLDNTHLGDTYSGYIHADSTQNTTNYG